MIAMGIIGIIISSIGILAAMFMPTDNTAVSVVALLIYGFFLTQSILCVGTKNPEKD